ncbi:MAG: hypothetical protein CL568_01555 [Alphaproteobacteria bacterium]|jgi:hypothetical protein|nr:hypothetical protein [Alphaproteobacteria bacterium]PPR13439.1 MAG: hypothetical protein CFH42_01191 [Alphaproteobacteria bacterium MarineAlpha12_Bin1]|tara:strand:+ start:1369 stop:1992 length:624 start_codon:yes stop_codon:yes gene_type:complete
MRKKLLIPLVLAVLLFGLSGFLLGVVVTGKVMELDSVNISGTNGLNKRIPDPKEEIIDRKLELITVKNQLRIEREKILELQNKMQIELTRILFTNPNYQNFSPTIDSSIEEGIRSYLSADYVKSYDIMLPHAINGVVRAQFYLGALYFEGRRVLRNRLQSYLWLDLAAKSSYPGAKQLIDRLRIDMSSEELLDVLERTKLNKHPPVW